MGTTIFEDLMGQNPNAVKYSGTDKSAPVSEMTPEEAEAMRKRLAKSNEMIGMGSAEPTGNPWATGGYKNNKAMTDAMMAGEKERLRQEVTTGRTGIGRNLDEIAARQGALGDQFGEEARNPISQAQNQALAEQAKAATQGATLGGGGTDRLLTRRSGLQRGANIDIAQTMNNQSLQNQQEARTGQVKAMTGVQGNRIGLMKEGLADQQNSVQNQLKVQEAEAARQAANAKNKQGFWGGIAGTAGKIFSLISDEDVKKNKKKDNGGKKALDKLKPYTYKYKNGLEDKYGKDTKSGVMAQDMEKAAPETVIETPQGKAIEAEGALDFILNSIEDINKRIDKVQKTKKRKY